MKKMVLFLVALMFLGRSTFAFGEDSIKLTSCVATLTISEAGEISGFMIGDTVYTEKSAGSAMTLLYSEASSQWEATEWVELTPDSAEVSVGNDAVAIHYPSFGGRQVSATLVLTADENGFIANAEIANSDSGVVVGARMLRMQGIEEFGGDLYIPDRAGQRLSSPFKKLLSDKYEFTYPLYLSAQFLIYSTGEQTWSLQVLDEDMKYKKLLLGDVFHNIEVEQYCFLEKGEKGSLAPVRLNAYEGDWHLASDQYRAWYDSWAEVVERSALIDEMPTISSDVILARPEEDSVLKDVTKDMELTTYEGALQRMTSNRINGFEGSQLVGWHGLGHDTDYPLHEVSEVMGGAEGLKRLTAHMENLGLQVGFYTNARLGNMKSPIYDQIEQWRIKPADGVDPRERYGAEWFEIICPMSEGFTQLIEDKARELTGEYHADFMQLDQIGAARSYLCFDASHGHSSPATAWAEGYEQFIKRVTAAGRENNPDFWVWCEGCWEGAGQFLDLQQGGVWDFRDAAYAPEIYRYTFPGHALMKDAFLGGVCMWVGTEAIPATDMMKNFEQFYVDAQFMDDVRLTWECESLDCKWHLGERSLAIVAQNTDAKAVAAAVSLEHELVELPETFYVVDMLSGELKETSGSDPLELTVAANGIGGLYLFW